MKPGRAPIITGARVRVVQGRQFQNFGAGDVGLAVHVDEDAGTCDVAFDGREGHMTVAMRYLEANPSSTAKSASAVVPHGPAAPAAPAAPATPVAPTPELLEEVLGAQRPRAGSNDSSATDPNGLSLEDGRPAATVDCQDRRPAPVLSASSSPPDRTSPQHSSQRARCVSEVLQDVRRVREAHRRGAATLRGAGELCGGEVGAALSEAFQASASATAAATANAVTEVGCLRQAFSELRELILLEAEQRVAGLREVQDGLEQVRAGQSPHEAGGESLLRAEQRRLEQKQAELISLCASLQSLKDQHPEYLTSPRNGQAAGPGALAGAQPSDWELSVQLPLTARLNSLDARLMLMDERLSLIGGQVAALRPRPAGPGQEPPSGWAQQLAALDSRMDALAQGEAQRNACMDALQVKISAEVEQAQQSLRAESARLGSELRSAATDVLGKVGGDAAGLLKAQADAERERSAKLMESLQARLDVLTEGLAAEARMREAAVSRVEAQVRRVGEAERKAPPRATSASPTGANGCCGGHPRQGPADKPVEPRALAGERPLEPRAVQTEKYAGQNLASLATQGGRLQCSNDRALRRLRAELGSSGNGAGASASAVGSPRLEKPLAAASGAQQPRTPRSGLPTGGSDQDAEAASGTPGSTAATTVNCMGEEGPPAPGPAPVPAATRVLRMESSPVRQKSAPQATVATQRGMLRGGLVGVDLNHNGRADLIVSGLDLGPDTLQHSGPAPSPQAIPGALTPGPPVTTAGPLAGAHLSAAAVQMSGHGPGGAVMPTGNMMSPGVPMMPLHMGATAAAGQPGMPGTTAGGLMWPSSLSSFGPMAPGGPFMPSRV